MTSEANIPTVKIKKKKEKVNLNITADPSYTDLKLPYRVICANRVKRQQRIQRKQFMKELGLHEILQTKALEGVRLHREFTNPILENPHIEEIITMTAAEKRRLEAILEYGYYQKVHIGKCPYSIYASDYEFPVNPVAKSSTGSRYQN